MPPALTGTASGLISKSGLGGVPTSPSPLLPSLSQGVPSPRTGAEAAWTWPYPANMLDANLISSTQMQAMAMFSTNK